MSCEKINCDSRSEIQKMSMSLRDLMDLAEIRRSMYEDATEGIFALSEALKEAILQTRRVETVLPGNRVEWTKQTLRLANLCGLDLSGINPIIYKA